jgi:hypothetical protein
LRSLSDFNRCRSSIVFSKGCRVNRRVNIVQRGQSVGDAVNQLEPSSNPQPNIYRKNA